MVLFRVNFGFILKLRVRHLLLNISNLRLNMYSIKHPFSDNSISIVVLSFSNVVMFYTHQEPYPDLHQDL